MDGITSFSETLFQFTQPHPPPPPSPPPPPHPPTGWLRHLFRVEKVEIDLDFFVFKRTNSLQFLFLATFLLLSDRVPFLRDCPYPSFLLFAKTDCTSATIEKFFLQSTSIPSLFLWSGPFVLDLSPKTPCSQSFFLFWWRADPHLARDVLVLFPTSPPFCSPVFSILSFPPLVLLCVF